MKIIIKLYKDENGESKDNIIFQDNERIQAVVDKLNGSYDEFIDSIEIYYNKNIVFCIIVDWNWDWETIVKIKNALLNREFTYGKFTFSEIYNIVEKIFKIEEKERHQKEVKELSINNNVIDDVKMEKK